MRKCVPASVRLCACWCEMTHSIYIVSRRLISVISLLTMYTLLLGAAACFVEQLTEQVLSSYSETDSQLLL